MRHNNTRQIRRRRPAPRPSSVRLLRILSEIITRRCVRCARNQSASSRPGDFPVYLLLPPSRVALRGRTREAACGNACVRGGKSPPARPFPPDFHSRLFPGDNLRPHAGVLFPSAGQDWNLSVLLSFFILTGCLRDSRSGASGECRKERKKGRTLSIVAPIAAIRLKRRQRTQTPPEKRSFVFMHTHTHTRARARAHTCSSTRIEWLFAHFPPQSRSLSSDLSRIFFVFFIFL